MHTLAILLTKATTKDEAKTNINSFMEEYGDGQVWDWFVIGGRWSGQLNKNNQKFKDTVRERNVFEDNNMISVKDVEDNQEVLQGIWEELGEFSKHPYNRDSYDNRGNDEDIMHATKCEEIIKRHTRDIEKSIESKWQEILSARRRAKDKEMHDSSGYLAREYADLVGDDFSFESTTFDVDAYTNNPPKDLTNYYAVVVDMHN